MIKRHNGSIVVCDHKRRRLGWSRTITVQHSSSAQQIKNARIDLLAGFHIAIDGLELPGFHQPRLQALLAYLLLNRQKPQSRRQIAFQFWPDSSEKQAQTNLRKLVHMLRKFLPDADLCLEVTSTTLFWLPTSPYEVDIALFEQSLANAKNESQSARKCQYLEQAIAVYRGELLPQQDSEWIRKARQLLREQYVGALAEHIQLLEESRDYHEAVVYARRLLQQDRFQESSYRILMRLHLLLDDRASALRVFHDCATLLSEELGVDPSLSTQQLHLIALNLEDNRLQQQIPTKNPNKLKLVGRADAWGALTSAWKQARTGRASLFLIQGVAGIGKTRLAEELVDKVNRLGFSTLHTRAYAAVGSAAYAPIANLLRAAPLQTRVNLLEEVWLVELSRLLPELRTTRPTLPEPLPITESWQQRRFYEAMSRLLLLVNQPLLLHFDDLQWSDPESIAWLQFLLEFDQGARLLVVGTIRFDEIDEAHPIMALHQDLHRRRRSVSIELGPLHKTDTAKLVQQFVEYDLSEAALTRLQDETEGSPLYTIELLHAGRHMAGGDEPASDEQQALPSNIETVIQWRLQQLSEPARQLVAAAAVIGRGFTHELLSAASEFSDDTLIRSLDELWRRRIIRERGAVSYDFAHDFIRDVAYRSSGPIWQRLYHRRVAQALPILEPKNVGENSARIAAHFEATGLLPQAREYYERAGDYAASNYVSKEALAFYSQAMASLPDNALAARFALHLKREDVIQRTNDIVAWQAELQKIVQIAELLQTANSEDVGPAIEALIRLNSYETMSSSTQQTARLQEAIALAQQHNQVALEARAQAHLGAAFITESNFTAAKQTLQQALALAQDHSLEVLALHINESLAEIFMFTGGSRETIEAYIVPLLDASRRAGSISMEANCYNKFGYLIVAQGEGNYDRARQYYERGLQLAQRHGFIRLECFIASNLGVLYTNTGQYTEAQKMLHHAVLQAEQINFIHWQGVRLNYLAELFCNMGHYEEARITRKKSLDYLESKQRGVWIGKANSESGLMEFTLGRNVRALHHFDTALAIIRKIGDRRMLGKTLTRQGRTLTALKRFPEARAAFQQACQTHHALEQTNRAIMAVAGLAEVALYVGDLDEASNHVEAILAHLKRRELDYTDESLAVYMSAFHVLQHAADERAKSMLQLAVDHLHKRAGSLKDKSKEKIFWAAPPHLAVMQTAATHLPDA